MNKQQFLNELRKGLSGLPESEINERLTFYSEIIDDRIEEGLSEEEAVKDVGDLNTIILQILEDVPLGSIVKEKIAPKRKMKAWEILLLVLGSPLWLSLLIALVAVILSAYIILWSASITLWAVFGAIIGCAIGGLVGGGVLAYTVDLIVGIALVGMGMICVGLSIYMFYLCKATVDGIVYLTKKAVLGIKSRFIGKEKA